MREISSGNPNTRIEVLDEPGQGGACHEYRIETSDPKGITPVAIVGQISFQNGPIKESGVNGCHQEDLLAIVIDRLKSFQAGPFACDANQIALWKCEEAIMWLNHRTKDRTKRGVEGVNKE